MTTRQQRIQQLLAKLDANTKAIAETDQQLAAVEAQLIIAKAQLAQLNTASTEES